jgi:hypothetical protein
VLLWATALFRARIRQSVVMTLHAAITRPSLAISVHAPEASRACRCPPLRQKAQGRG